MSNIFKVKQNFPRKLAQIKNITQERIEKEPTLRRASAKFARKNGGPILNEVMDLAEKLGIIAENTVILIQRNDFRVGGHSTPPEWHWDWTQGQEPVSNSDFQREVLNGNKGLIACIFDKNEHPHDLGTIFIDGGGFLTIDLSKRDREREYKANQRGSSKENGLMHWWHKIIQDQVNQRADLQERPIEVNSIYSFSSSDAHKVPEMRSNSGSRLLIRINTPTDPKVIPSYTNVLYKPSEEPLYIFRMDSFEKEKWFREKIK